MSRRITILLESARSQAAVRIMSKRRRLTTLGRESHVTQSGLCKLVRGFQKDGVPEYASRAVRYEARKERCSEPTLTESW